MRYNHKITYYLLTYFAKWLQSRPMYKNRVLAQKISSIFYHYITIRKAEAEQKIFCAFPDKPIQLHTHILKKCYQFFTYYFIHFLAFPFSYYSASISIKNKATLDGAVSQGLGIIIITGHVGAWELLNAWCGYNDYPVVGVVHKQNNPGSDIFFKELRELSGFKHLYRKEPRDKMYRVLKEGKMLGLVSDQDAKSRGVFINFLNQPASTPKGAARFHLKSKAPMVFVTCVEKFPNKYEINFQKVLSNPNDTVKDITQRYSTMLEEIIKQHPEQYFWWHRRWKTKPV